MASVQEHYDTHLAPLYNWMSGGAAGPRERFTALLRETGIRPTRPGAVAFDLGAGSGFQTLPLAAAGFAVTAVDLSAVLLAELEHDAANLPVKIVRGDLGEFLRAQLGGAAEVAVCMGDTLTHLATEAEVAQVLADAARMLAPDGWLLLSFRDYTVARHGPERFIPVRSDAERILTCFLDFGATHVAVHDIAHTRDGAGWRMAVSVYEKLRLAPDRVRAALAAAGLTLVRDETKNGLVTLVARRTAAS